MSVYQKFKTQRPAIRPCAYHLRCSKWIACRRHPMRSDTMSRDTACSIDHSIQRAEHNSVKQSLDSISDRCYLIVAGTTIDRPFAGDNVHSDTWSYKVDRRALCSLTALATEVIFSRSSDDEASMFSTWQSQVAPRSTISPDVQTWLPSPTINYDRITSNNPYRRAPRRHSVKPALLNPSIALTVWCPVIARCLIPL